MNLNKVFSFPTLTLIVALTLSVIAAYYSILGLTAIFAAAVIPIIIMGSALELAKVVTTLWLHRYWHISSWKLKAYLIPAVIVLAFLTSMGIFGFLSKAHSDQSLISGDTQAQLMIYDEKIAIAKENISTNRTAIAQMDSQVDQLLGRTTDDVGANRAVQVRRQQAAERERLLSEITQYQEEITKLNEQVAPIRAEMRKIDAEVGPIKYIAALVYGDNPDTNLLERAVRWVIILIVFVFDPLALVLVLAAQSSYRWLEKPNTVSSPDNSHDNSDTPIQKEQANQKDIIEKQIASIEPTEIDVNDYDAIIAGSLQDTIITEESTSSVKNEHKQIKTENVTLSETEGGYVMFNGKSVKKDALAEMHPELFRASPDQSTTKSGFGTEFPKVAKKDDVFVRVDISPNKPFKFDGRKWIEFIPENPNMYSHSEEYIKHLISKIEANEYDVSLLSESEKLQIEEFLKKDIT